MKSRKDMHDNGGCEGVWSASHFNPLHTWCGRHKTHSHADIYNHYDDRDTSSSSWGVWLSVWRAEKVTSEKNTDGFRDRLRRARGVVNNITT